MSILIGISGSHSVGKSTLVNLLKEKLGEEAFVVQEVARGVIDAGFQLGKFADIDSYVALLSKYVSVKTSLRRSNQKFVIFDRTMLDTLSYALVNLQYGKKVNSHVIDLLKAFWLYEKESFDKYFFVPVEFAEPESRTNGPDENYRNNVSDMIAQQLGLSGMQFTTVGGSREQRVEVVLGQLRGR